MRSDQITVHTRIRDEEKTIAWTLLSLAPYVKRVLVYDTGSTDGTIDIVRECQKREPNIELKTFNLPNMHFWTLKQLTDHKIERNEDILELRNLMIEETDTDYILIADGDEIWYQSDIDYIARLVNRGIPSDINYFAVPLHWICFDAFTRCTQSDFQLHNRVQTYPHNNTITTIATNRLFRRKNLQVYGTYPGENAKYNGRPCSFLANDCYYLEELRGFLHYEILLRPWRRRALRVENLPFRQPKVFSSGKILDINPPSIVYPKKGKVKCLSLIF